MSRRKRSQYLTPATEKLLRLMVENEEELVGDGGQWWVGLHRTNAKAVYRLLRLCLVRKSNIGGGCEIYYAETEAKTIIADPDYVPLIIRASRTGKAQFGD